ncbi:MAG: cob(I)yrinic acid a,c-diamide adenosyltransferase [Deltaproteobacteria bacterium]|nr:cob(I)yrinic acid a,c-diamide adenosyltransferase [Deltaproteobacteria bacterium]
MKIYTGTGDKGKTSLFSGDRVSKADAQIDTYGDLDELNSILGALAAHLAAEEKQVAELQQIQSDLLQAGAWLATRPDSSATDSLRKITKDQIHFLENAIDGYEKELPQLNAFILPGGHITAAWAHLARTVCRRCERKAVSFMTRSVNSQVAEPYQHLLVYLNRLSDYLFVLARHCNRIHDIADKPWKM